jgi:hypothetical protein
VRSAAGLYRLHAVIALGGGLGVLLGLLVALDASTTHRQPPGMLVTAVLFSPSTSVKADAALLLALGAIVAVTAGLGLRAVAAECRAQRRAKRLLHARRVVPAPSSTVRVFAEERPRAFCHGLLRPHIYVSSGAWRSSTRRSSRRCSRTSAITHGDVTRCASPSPGCSAARCSSCRCCHDCWSATPTPLSSPLCC